ncbi:hypothetical protein DM02DRAFT_673642 [Periconia macrospinosa]|uniref:ShKT domain-containing protein n=1 Tax=Periconia macrospinosa TaxID=97972 RepID=A0A2V1DIT3_9PLEO|nr:hypothetical protein DM02DRAFT_673642 [Periconia macrospinosa]
MKFHLTFLVASAVLASAWTNILSPPQDTAPANISISTNATSSTIAAVANSSVPENASASMDVFSSDGSANIAAVDENNVQTTDRGRCDKKCTDDWEKCVKTRCWAYEWGCPKVCMYTICEIGPNECGGCQWC